MKFFLGLAMFTSTVLFPLNVFAFHAVTEVLSSNKILVCKDADEVIKGSKVEVYKLKMGTKEYSRALEKVSEFNLPTEGQKVELLHKEFHFNGKLLPNYHDAKKGTATVVAPKLAGEEFKTFKIANNKSEKNEQTTVKISPEQEAEFAKKCFVAVPDSQVNLKDVTSIAF